MEPTDTDTATGVARYLVTDQVRFTRGETPLALSEVPAHVFSEVMRDVDLLVGVCSPGNDPEWQDHGDPKAGKDVFLVFQGNTTLSVILSKAFLLMEDDKITDERIIRQIRPQ